MIIFDLDGTLALDHHRSHHLKKSPKDWDSYFAACDHDEPNVPIVAILEALVGDLPEERMVLWSGRSMKVFDKTKAWLQAHQLFYLFDEIKLRAIDDRTDDTEMKRRWLHEARAQGFNPRLVFEDRQRVVDMWREEGLVCCQVAPGQF